MKSPRIAPSPVHQVPLYRRLADAIVLDIRRGRLAPGEKLPSSRALAAQAQVHRNTALAAYDELRAQGWIITEHKRGTYVAHGVPRDIAAPAALLRPDRPGFALPTGGPSRRRRAPQGVLNLGGGLPDNRLSPVKDLARAYRRVLARRGPELLDYGDPRGEPRLRRALSGMLATHRGVVAGEGELLITRGSQMGLYLVARALLRSGDRVAVEAYGYTPAWQALRLSGAKLLGVPVDDQGLDVDRLMDLHHRKRLRAVYVTPHHQFPTTAMMSSSRRLALLSWAAREGVAIIEDDYDHEFHYEGRPVLPLFSDDRAGVVVYLGTLSKVFAPGLRIGYVVAPRAVIERMATYRLLVDHHGDPGIEAAVAELIEEGELMRHVGRARRAYRERRDHLVELLSTRLSDELCFAHPLGGMALWLTVRGLDPEAWAEAALAQGIWLTPGARYAFAKTASPHLRMGFAAGTLDELERAVEVLVRTRRAARPSRALHRSDGLG